MLPISRSIGRLPSAPAPRSRAAVRRNASGKIMVEAKRGEGSAARLRDISIYGCNLISDSLRLRTGMFISLRLAEGLDVHAVVRWVRGDVSGVEFLRPIAATDAEQIDELAWAG